MITLAELAPRFAATVVEAARREYPNAAHHVATGPADRPTNRELHPAFYGCFDWHSAVHMHDALVRLLRVVPDAFDAAPARSLLAEHLTADRLAAEARYVAAHPTWERPYGWGWALALADDLAALAGAGDAQAAGWSDAMRPLADVVAANAQTWLDKAQWPVRGGMHTNSALGLVLMRPWASRLAGGGSGALLAAIDAAARRWFGADRNYPLGWEPSGTDFCSPFLTEAQCMAAALGPGFAAWFDGFAPAGLGPLAEPVVPTDPADGQLAHLLGLNLSRAWGLRTIAAALGAEHRWAAPAQVAADGNVAASLDQVTGGDYMATHWLVSYAIVALADIG